jgi:predicted nucleotidyltransferase
VLFGSRAKGTAKPSSDIDLAIDGLMHELHAEALARELDELPLPYRFDVQASQCMRHDAVREHIARVGIVIYTRTPASA